MTIIHFNTLPTPLKEVESDDPNSLTKEGLIFYSTLENSPHVDSRKVKHDFSPDKIYQLVENTNKHFDMSEVGIPVLTEHKKDVNNVVGFIESPVEARIIDEVYTKGNPKLKHLLGRVGVFVKDVVIKTPEIIDRMKRGLAKTVSAGIDLDSFSIKELSLVALPAIPNATLFSYHGSKNKSNMKKVKNKNLLTNRSYSESNYALSLDEAINAGQTLEQQRDEAMKLFNAFLEVIEDANEINEEEMASMGIQDASEVIQSAIEDLSARLGDMFLGDMGQDDSQQPQQSQQPSNGRPNQQPSRGRFNSPSDIALFYTGQGYTAEFGYRQAISGAFKQLRNRNYGGATKTSVNNLTGKTSSFFPKSKSVGQIGSELASKLGNATRGKFGAMGRGINRAVKTVTGGGFTKDLIPKATQNQLNQSAKQLNKYGRQSTNPKIPKLPPNPDIPKAIKKPKV